MPGLEPLSELEIGVMFWAGRDPAQTIAELTEMGVRCGQLAIPGDLDLECAATWREALGKAGFTVTTVFAAYEGESYADKPTVAATVGFIPEATRERREHRTLEVSDFAATLGAPAIATHIGCLPEDSGDPDYQAVLGMVRRICDYAASRGQKFALETGQEPAAALLEFFKRVDRPNLGINFDPANMILYGTGDPVEALETLSARVISVHCKDGDWPPADDALALGTERPLGKGSVGMERFLRKLVQVGYKGTLNVERETEDPQEKLRDVRMGTELIRELKTALMQPPL